MQNKEAYGRRLLLATIEANQVEMVREELKKVLAVLKKQPQFLEIFKSPTMTMSKRKEWLEAAFAGEISQILMEFLVFLVDEEVFDRLDEIEAFYDETIRCCLEADFGLVEGTVYSAISLENVQLEQLEAVFSKKLNKQVTFVSVVNPSLIGGYRVEVSGHVYDDTVGVKLQQLKASLHQVNLD